jgi:hypothetical protein
LSNAVAGERTLPFREVSPVDAAFILCFRDDAGSERLAGEPTDPQGRLEPTLAKGLGEWPLRARKVSERIE